jgi:ABC-type transport system involved in multi-copper enzyme maturation permease subunit
MLSLIIIKELKSILLSPKFPATFGACSILILLSVFVGIREYKAAAAQTASTRQLVEQEQREATSWANIENRVFREPDPMQVFVAGLHNDIGRLSDISSTEAVKLAHSVYSDDPIFAVFRFIDFAFIVQVVLSLFAVLFTYDAVNGEREGGTLALTFSNAVPRARYLGGKLIGAWLGLVLPVTIPVLLSVLIVMLSGVPFLREHWIRFAMLMGISLLYFTFFAMSGVLISSLTKRSSVSFLLSLVVWIALVLIVPRAGVMAAGQIVTVPTVAQMDGQIAAYSKERWARHGEQLEKRWQERSAAMKDMSGDERTAYRKQHEWSWLEEDDGSRKEVQKDIDRQTAKYMEDMRNRKQEQVRLGLTLSRFSPASAFQLAAMQLAGTDVDLKTRYEDAMQTYRRSFIAYNEKKQQESGGSGGIRITVDSEHGFSFQTPREAGTLNMSDMPRFEAPKIQLPEYIVPAFIDIGLLVVVGMMVFAGAFVAFLRYDVR